MNFYVNLHTHTFLNNVSVIEVVNNYPNETITSEYFSAGIHPWYIHANWKEELEIVKQKLVYTNNLALGECGLDTKIDIPMPLQQEVFMAQLKIAQQLDKPLIIHCVGAFQQLIQLKKQLKITVPMIVHGFSKNLEIAQELCKHTIYISFGKYLFLNPNLPNVFKQIPIENVFLETDTSDFTIEEVYKKAAELKNTSINELKEKIYKNYKKVFKKSSI